MSCFGKLFSKLFGFQPKPEFILHSITFKTPESESLSDGDLLWATIDFESRYDCRIWMFSQVKEDELPNGGYMPSDVLPAGRHTIERYFYLNDIDAEKYPNGLTVTGAILSAKSTNNDALYHEVHNINYVYKPFSSEELAQRQTADKDNLNIEFVSVRYDGHILSPNDSISIDSQITVRIQAECNENVRFSCVPLTDLSYGFDPISETVDGLLDLNFNMNEIGDISGFMIKAYNRYDIAIESLQIDFPLKVENWHDDGQDAPITFEPDNLYYANMADENDNLIPVDEHSTIAHNTDLSSYMYLNHQAKHGVIVWIYDMLGSEIGECIFKSSLLSYDECQEDDNPCFIINWEDVDFSENPVREISGFYFQLTNVAGDVLAEQTVEHALTIRQNEE
ncbi:hypothetical protein MIS45_07430 [Wielerella bovis]|uniref:hypothetical protein n=1 Tax=Wielerella bovis TaxID=2917790 RepID=UPI002018CC0C|nr:hypothetical protein [Wielerella bovis]ULJ68629.1 hypothetical protein MIS45_07430 [Wielerella bovis]